MIKTSIFKTFTIATGIVMSLSLPSCMSKSVIVRADDYDAETIVDYMNEEEESIILPVTSVHNHTPQQVQPSRTTPTKKEVVVKTPLDGEWFIVEAAGKSISRDDDMPYIIFSDKEGRFYASNGCNVINGDFNYANGTVTFSKVVSTKMMCPDEAFYNAISAVLNEDVSVKTKIENRDRESYLYIYSKSNDLLMKLRRHNLEVINGQWEVSEIGNEEVDGSEINLFFDIPEHSIHGNTGCNYFNGVIVIDNDKSSSLSFSQMGVTMRYCDNADIERMLLVALEETETYTLPDNHTLYLNDADGKRLITLTRK